MSTTVHVTNPQTGAAGWSVFGTASFEAAGVLITPNAGSQSGAVFHTAKTLTLDGLTINFTTTMDGSADGETLFLWDPAQGVPAAGMSLSGGGSLAADNIYGSSFRMPDYDPGSPGFYWYSHPYPSGQTQQKAEYHPNSYVTGTHVFALTFTKTGTNTFTVKRIRDGVDLGDWTGITAPEVFYLGFTAATGGASGNHRVSGVSATSFAPDPVSSPSAYGGSSYGGGSNVSPSTGAGAQVVTSAGRSTVTFGMTTIPRAGDIVVIPVTAGDQPGDIILEPQQGPDSITASPAGVSTVTMGMGERYLVRAAPAGVAADSFNTGVRYRTLTTSNGQAGASSLNGLFTNSWYLGSPFHVTMTAVGRAGCINNEISVYSGAVFTSRVFVYPSTTPPDVNLAPESGPGATKSMVSTNQGIGHMTAVIGGLHRLVTTSNGVATARNIFGATGSWYLGSPFHIDSTMAGAGGARNIFGATGSWYLGSPFHIDSTSAGRGGGYNYLGSPFHVTMTSNGQGGCTRNYVSGAIFLTVAFHGYGGARDQFGTTGRWYLGSSTRMAATSAGRAAVVNYLSTPVPMGTTISNGRAATNVYLGSPFHVTSTAYAQAHVNVYMSSRVYFAGTSPGRAGGTIYLGTPFHVTSTSAGRATLTLSMGAGVYPVTYMRGVAHWELGPQFQYAHVMQGIGHVNDIRLSGTQRHNATSNGVATFHDNDEFISMTSNGSSRYTEFDKPPFAFVCNAGCNAYRGSGYRPDSGILYNYISDGPYGVFAYMSAPIRFGNHDYNIEGRGNASMSGQSSFTFPYEMVARADAGCRSFVGYRSDQNPAAGFPGYTDGTRQGVFAKQTSPDYMYARTNTPNSNGIYSAGAYAYAYMSSRVYQSIVSHGRSTAFFLRINEADFHGVGGMLPTLGVDHRNFGETISNGRGGWPVNYLPDRRAFRMFTHGVANAFTTQAGKVHFEAGDVTSHGVGNFYIDPGLLFATSNGVGHVFDILRPDQVGMQWGSGEFYYTRHFPVIAPLLIPNGSNGMSEFIIEIDGVAVIHHHMNGIGAMSIDIGGIAKGMRNQNSEAGCYPWMHAPIDPDHLGQESRSRYGGYLPPTWTLRPQGVEIAFTPVQVVWQPNGIGHMRSPLRLYYALAWDQGNNEYFDATQGRFLPTGNHPSVYQLSGGGGRGHFYVAGPRQVASRSNGRAGAINNLYGIFAAFHPIRGIATAILYDIGGGLLYGDMLAINFSNRTPVYGQLWPRRMHLYGLPV